jgi:hypothetical protein
MWIAWLVFGVVSALVIVAALSLRRRPTRPKRTRQPPVASPEHGRLPDPRRDDDGDDVAHRPDGSLMPGSEEYRNRQGRA